MVRILPNLGLGGHNSVHWAFCTTEMCHKDHRDVVVRSVQYFFGARRQNRLKMVENLGKWNFHKFGRFLGTPGSFLKTRYFQIWGIVFPRYGS